MTACTVLLAGLILADGKAAADTAAVGGAATAAGGIAAGRSDLPGIVESFFIVDEEAPIRDAATGKPLAPLWRGTWLWRRTGDAAFRSDERTGTRILIDPKAIMSVDQALKYFDDRIRKKPAAADYADRAAIHLFLGRYDDADDDLDQALKLQPDFYRALLRRADCQTRQSLTAGSIARSRLLPRSLEDAEKCVALGPDDFHSYEVRSRSLSPVDSVRAAADAAKALELRGDPAAVLNDSAKRLLDAGRNAEAFEQFTRALELNPEYWEAYARRAAIHRAAGRFDEAIADATRAIRFDPFHAWVWSLRGDAHLETKRYVRAIQDFSEAVRLDPYGPKGYAGRGEGYSALGRARREVERRDPSTPIPDGHLPSATALARAVADCRKAIALDPNVFPSYNTLADVLKSQDDPREAIGVLTNAIIAMRVESRANPRSVPIAGGGRADVWAAVETTLQFADKGTFDPRTQEIAWTHPHRATIAAIMVNRSGARRMLALAGEESQFGPMLRDLTRAMLFDPNNPDYLLARGHFHLEQKRYTPAFTDLNQAVRLRPDFTTAIQSRILAAGALGKFDLAWEDVRKLAALKTPADAETLAWLKKISRRDQ